jgi:4-amino-4-deoxy-L-arabinose transferase-like glycosyltransferase
MKKILISLFPLIIVIILSSFFRFILLDRIPSGISNDELDYVLTAKSVFLTGKEINGVWSPISFTMDPAYLLVPVARATYLIIAPLIGILPFSLFNARLPYVLINLGLIVVIYLITRRVLNSKVALFVGLIVSINPWFIFIGRTAYEAPVSLFFAYLSFYILLVAKKWKILLAIPFFAIALYSYLGFSIILLPFIAFISLYVWLENDKKYKIKYLILFSVCLLIFVSFALSIKQQRVSYRVSELSNPNSSTIAKIVNDERRVSVKTPIIAILSNKYTVFLNDVIIRYSKVFSTEFLFAYGEGTPTFSLRYHGVFYYIDAVFLLLGIYYLFRFKRRLFVLLLGIILISPLPSVIINLGETYVFRSVLLLPSLTLIIGTGIWHASESIKNKRNKTILYILLVFLYLISIINFLNVYFLRNPIYNSEEFAFSNRIIARYIHFAQNEDKKIFVIENGDAHNIYKQVTFYNNEFNGNNAYNYSKNYRQGNLEFKNVKFMNCPLGGIDNTETVIDGNKCMKSVSYTNKLSIPLLADGGTVFDIYNDMVCSKYNLRRYPQNITLSQLNVEEISEKEFCETYIVNLYQ